MVRSTVARFGIGEWFGHSFVLLSEQERKSFADIALNHTKESIPVCPFQSVPSGSVRCTKKGGVCSLRLYEVKENGGAKCVEGNDGKLRVVCPQRFKQNNTIYSVVAESIIDTNRPAIVPEVRFLRRNSVSTVSDEGLINADTKSEDVGNIDTVLVNIEGAFQWCALELQAVYFSGERMNLLFNHIREFEGSDIPFPDRIRRPDYRSSGPKRLMPQLQIKVPTLRRWGKKMAVVVDVPWFETNVIGVETVTDISNADIAWFLVDFDESTNPATLFVSRTELQTLERAVEGLTGGLPVNLQEFESKIRLKLPRI